MDSIIRIDVPEPLFNPSLPLTPQTLPSIYICIRDCSDPVVAFHSEAALGELDSMMRNQLFIPQTGSKEINHTALPSISILPPLNHTAFFP